MRRFILACALLAAAWVSADASAARLLVHVKPGVSAAAARRALAAAQLRPLRTIRQLHVVVAEGQRPAELPPALSAVETDGWAHVAGADPYPELPWVTQQLNLGAAWSVTRGSTNTVIAVVDTGVNADADLSGVLLPGTDLVDGDGDVSDPVGHGTAAAITIAATADNSIGYAGSCRCSILPVRALGADGTGRWDTIAQGVIWAADHGARVINLSIGGTDGSSTLGSAIEYAQDKGALVVAAAGNSGSTTQFYPAAYPNVLAVAATDQSGQLAPYSNHGASWVQLAAPGATLAPYDGGPGQWTGTSFAAPQVSAVAGLAFSWNPMLTADAVAAALEQTARPGLDVADGSVDALAMFRQLGAAEPPVATDPPPPVGSEPDGLQLTSSPRTPTTTPATTPPSTSPPANTPAVKPVVKPKLVVKHPAVKKPVPKKAKAKPHRNPAPRKPAAKGTATATHPSR
ncbi:MAG: S8 family serine peptidase [Gaiellaceae bacterium]